MLGKTCRICMHKKALFQLPSCTHAICKTCWNTLVKNSINHIVICPFCRKKYKVKKYKVKKNNYFETLKQMHPIQQGLIIFATIKLIYG